MAGGCRRIIRWLVAGQHRRRLRHLTGGLFWCPPAPDWVCVNGGWVPPDHPLAGGAAVPLVPLPARAGGGA